MIGREKKESVKIGELFFCSPLLAELNFHCSAEQNPPFKNPRSAIGNLNDATILALWTYFS